MIFFYTILFVLVIAFINSAETAIYSVSELKLQALNSKNAQILLKIKSKIGQVIGAVSITINTINQVGTVWLGIMAKQVFENDNWFGVYISSLVLAVILFGEIIPKNFGENFSLRYSLFIAPLVKFWIWILGPIVGILDRLITKIFPNDKTAFSTSKEEIRIMVQMGEKENSIRKGESELIHNVFKMNDKIAKNIMTPRVNIEALDINLTFKEQELDIFDASHSRLPIYSQDCDDIRGFVLMREILEAMASGKTDQKPDDYLYDILVINEYIKVDVLLMLFKKKRTHIALVKDEFGGTAGIVTLEDVLEELVGEIIDETDEQEDMRSNKNLVCG